MSQPCPNCGTLNLDSYRFCSNCGTLLRPTEAANTAAPTPASYAPPSTPQPPVDAETARAVSMPETQTQTQPPGEPAYVVKTSPDAESLAAQAATVPIGAGFVPPAPGGAVPQQPPAGAPSFWTQSTGYPSTASGPSGGFSKETGVYTPYTPGQVTALEKPEEKRSWLVPVVVVAALLLVGLAAIGIYATQNKGGTSQGRNTVSQPNPTKGGDLPTPTSLPANAKDEDKVREVIRRSNDMQVIAWKELNSDVLSEYYTGKALAENVDMVNQLRQRNMSAEPHNEKLDILDVKVEGDTATAHTLEVWTVTFISKSDNRRDVKGPDTLRETYYLVKKDGKWYVNDLVIPTSVPPTPTKSGT